MAVIIFHEKSGCATNARQKAQLIAAGHSVLPRDLRDTAWDAARLNSFLAALPVSQWFNRNAPAVKNGEINPDSVDAATALQLLQANPLLIRRPLLEIDAGTSAELQVGFDAVRLAPYLHVMPGNAEACSHAHAPCPDTQTSNLTHQES